jgi:hypothetical protein
MKSLLLIIALLMTMKMSTTSPPRLLLYDPYDTYDPCHPTPLFAAAVANATTTSSSYHLRTALNSAVASAVAARAELARAVTLRSNYPYIGPVRLRPFLNP